MARNIIVAFLLILSVEAFGSDIADLQTYTTANNHTESILLQTLDGLKAMPGPLYCTLATNSHNMFPLWRSMLLRDSVNPVRINEFLHYKTVIALSIKYEALYHLILYQGVKAFYDVVIYAFSIDEAEVSSQIENSILIIVPLIYSGSFISSRRYISASLMFSAEYFFLSLYTTKGMIASFTCRLAVNLSLFTLAHIVRTIIQASRYQPR